MRGVDRSLGAFFRNGVRVSLTRPGQAWQFARTLRWQAAAAKTRGRWQKRGLCVPPIIIFSITHQCDLHCVGCYEHALWGAAGSIPRAPVRRDELSAARLESIVTEAAEIGVSFFVIAGGEPLMRPEILDIAERFPRVVFLVFTNGLLLDEAMVARLARLKNVVCLLSLEGDAAHTDQRRGEGIYERLVVAMARLKKKRLFFGCSLTITRGNFATVLDDGYIGDLTQAGCRLFLVADYTPVDETTREWVLSDEQRQQVASRMLALRKGHPALFVAVPWDEDEVGGCLSAGRGFVHINASGDVEPCPFAPYSDVNLNEASLAEALRSPFLAGLRAMPGLSEDTEGGCALWKNRERVEKVLVEARARTGPDPLDRPD